MSKIEINTKTGILNPLTGVYAVQVNKNYYLEERIEKIRIEPVDIKNFEDLKKIAKELGEENLRAEEKSKEEKQPYCIQKILVVL